jgi:hypothetical protein
MRPDVIRAEASKKRPAKARMGRSAMSEKIYDVPAEWKQRALIDDAKYREMYASSLKDPNGFWA